MNNSDLKTLFDNIESYTSFERKKKVSELTNNYDLNLLTEFSNSFVEHCFSKFSKLNSGLPNIEIEQIESKEGDIWLNEFHFPFYDFIKGEIQKEIRVEKFSNIDFNDCIKFNSYMNGFLVEIETIIENQNITINGKNTTQEPEAIDLTESIFNKIITILKRPIWSTLYDDYGDFIGYDENKNEVYKEIKNSDLYDTEKDIKKPFSELKKLTFKLIEVTKNPIIIDGLLKTIFRELNENFTTIIEYENEISTNNNKINFPKNRASFVYYLKSNYGNYYDFLIDYIKTENFKTENNISLDENGFHIIKKDNEQLKPEAIDLSDTSITEKIIYLHKLGVLDFLKSKQPFLSSTNSLASVLSAVTGANAGTIQSMINPILSKKVDDKNNPMNSIKPVNKVQKQLNDIGFNLNETN